ncbi:hypothetical protein [Anabaena azotica]|uniref:hypothetical protein n=1 Tax=Anabaena azotica TaxID=197653 RepID=UPI0039A4D505
MDFLEIDALVNGIIYSNEAAKQDLGRRFAAYLGLTPGKPGSDGGIDGYAKLNNDMIYFQSKLSQNILDASYTADINSIISLVYYLYIYVNLNTNSCRFSICDRREFKPR